MDAERRAYLRRIAGEYMTFPPRSNKRNYRLYALGEAMPDVLDALDAAEARVAALREALEFYADPKFGVIAVRARAALAADDAATEGRA